MDNKNGFGVITEQGFVAGQLGFNEMTKEEHDKLLNSGSEDSEKNSQ